MTFFGKLPSVFVNHRDILVISIVSITTEEEAEERNLTLPSTGASFVRGGWGEGKMKACGEGCYFFGILNRYLCREEMPIYSEFDQQLPNLLSTVRLKTLIKHGGKIALSVISNAMYLAVRGCKSDVQQFPHPAPLLRHHQHHTHQRNLHAPFSSGVLVARSSSVWVKIYWQELLVPRSTT